MAKLTPAVAVGIIASMGLANALGRVFWGFISDKIGRLAALLLMFIATSDSDVPPARDGNRLSDAFNSSTCYLCMLWRLLGIFPSVCADYFGPKNLTVNYAMLFSAFSIAAVAGPKVGVQIFLSSGSYANAFVVAGAVSCLGGVLTVVSMLTRKKAA